MLESERSIEHKLHVFFWAQAIIYIQLPGLTFFSLKVFKYQYFIIKCAAILSYHNGQWCEIINLNLRHLYSTSLEPCEGFQVRLTLSEGFYSNKIGINSYLLSSEKQKFTILTTKSWNRLFYRKDTKCHN